MSKIRKLYYFDKKSTEEMISFLNNSAADTYINHIMFNPLIPLHHLLPLSLKFLPESYILKENKIPKGLITIAPTKTHQKKLEIQKLFFEEGAYSDAAELVQYVVSKYKAMGATSIMVKVDDYLPELLSMLISRCGFSQISYEKIWRINKEIVAKYDKSEYRAFRNSDANVVANIYNDSLLPHIRPLLNSEPADFKENLFQGLSYYSEYKYVIEDKRGSNVLGCIIIKTYDNENYIIEVLQTGWVDLDINSVIAYATYQIRKRKKKFGLFIKSRRYTQVGERYEAKFIEEGFECVQNQIVLTNSSARVLKEPIKTARYTILGDFCSSKTMPT